MLIPLNSYHQNTKHSYNSIRTNPNRVDWNNPPNKFKFYSKDYKRVHLNSENKNYNFFSYTFPFLLFRPHFFKSKLD